jgi:alkylation response protein AidB-like acyl-CoA dehydrogenase
MQHRQDDDQRLIAEAATQLFDREFSLATLRRFAHEPRLPDAWRGLFGDSGWLGLCANENAGGSGLGALHALPLLIEAGRHAVPFPLAANIVAAQWLARVPQHQEKLAAILQAQDLVCIADRPGDALRAQSAADGWLVSGSWAGVSWADESRWFMAPMPLEGAPWALIDLEARSVARLPRKCLDTTSTMSRVTLNAHAVVAADLLGPAPRAWRNLRALFAAAELQGAAKSCLDMSVAYMKERQQFGQPIGRFQALKHIAADGALSVENMRVANEFAAWAHDAGAADAGTAVQVAKSYASEQARSVAENAIQCHGGMGFTWDYGLHFFLRRIVALGATAGTAHEHREDLIADLVRGIAAANPDGVFSTSTAP